MVDAKSVEAQFKRLKFNYHAWGRAECGELPHILLPEEKIYECVNGMYEGGFALLVSTDIRVLLVDKKPLKYLTVEDLRFDMINEIDYSHRLFGAHITISAGNKILKFTSYNQPRLRKLIGHVQNRMSEIKQQQNYHAEGQKQHLEQINQQLQTYLVAQHNYQLELQQRLQQTGQVEATKLQAVAPPRPSPEVADYLFTQSLLQEYKQQTGHKIPELSAKVPEPNIPAAESPLAGQPIMTNTVPADELYAEGMKEVFGRALNLKQTSKIAAIDEKAPTDLLQNQGLNNTASYDGQMAKDLEVNAMRIAYAKLPMMLRNRKFGRPSFHAHSQVNPTPKVTDQYSYNQLIY
ncbi:MAG TPA: PH domain-containing protein [Candidatus Dormibacteraeota bacterium]|nr:PH domain-containing protein [Candidatus Dormibacteraeota bacterium]